MIHRVHLVGAPPVGRRALQMTLAPANKPLRTNRLIREANRSAYWNYRVAAGFSVLLVETTVSDFAPLVSAT